MPDMRELGWKICRPCFQKRFPPSVQGRIEEVEEQKVMEIAKKAIRGTGK